MNSFSNRVDLSKKILSHENSDTASSVEWQRTLAFVISAIMMSQALQFSSGYINVIALSLLSFSFLWCLFAVITIRASWPAHKIEKLTYRVLQIGVLLQFMQFLAYPLDIEMRYTRGALALYLSLIAIAGFIFALSYFSAAFQKRFRYNSWQFPALLLIHFCMGVWVIVHVPDPAIDVFVIQRDAAQALLNGINPYTITFPNAYGNAASIIYGAGLTNGDRFLFGYVYPPLSVLMAIPGQILGDVRYTNLFCLSASGALLAYARPSRLSFWAATLFLFFPPFALMLMKAWTDAYVIFLFALLLFVACRIPRLKFLPFGLLMVVKQHLFLAAPLALLLVTKVGKVRTENRWHLWKMFGLAAVVGLLVTLPFILWNPQAFIKNVILLNFDNPFRSDSLNYAAFWFYYTKNKPSSLIGFVLLIPTYYLIMKFCPRTPSGFAGATALLYFVFFLFGRQAFLNYYYFVFAALCGAITCFEGASKDEKRSSSPEKIQLESASAVVAKPMSLI